MKQESAVRVAFVACCFVAATTSCSKYAKLVTKRPSAGAPLSVELLKTRQTPGQWDLALIADPQLHNYLGGPILSMSPSAARSLTRVARRPAVLNLLGQLVLETFVERLDAALVDSPGRLILALGDAANVSCTNEFDRFVESMERRVGGAWLAVHGNHDSFMSGNLSAYQRVSAWPTTWPDKHAILPRETRWSPTEAAAFAYPNKGSPGRYTSWAQACADPSLDSAPMTKGVWTRRYLMALERQGVTLKISANMLSPAMTTASAAPNERGTTPFNVANCRAPFRFNGAASKKSALGAKNFLLSGVWRPRALASGGKWRESDRERCPFPLRPPSPEEAEEWAGFIVQSVELGADTTAILIDTAVREATVSVTDFGVHPRFPGTKAFLGAQQIEHIGNHVINAKGRKIVFVGHHPWKDLYDTDRKALLRADPVLYISGHTHFETSFIVHGPAGSQLPELNVASLMDWPMEAALLSTEAGRVLWKIVGLHDVNEGHLGCGSPAEQSFYEPLLPSATKLDCTEFVDERDLGIRRGWREHQVQRSEAALQWLAPRWQPPFEPPAPATAWATRARNVKDAVEKQILAASREGHEQRDRGVGLARCASRAVALGWRAPIESTCPRRDSRVHMAASLAGFKYRVARAPG